MQKDNLDMYMISEIFSLKRCVCIDVNAERQFGHVHDFRDFLSLKQGCLFWCKC